MGVIRLRLLVLFVASLASLLADQLTVNRRKGWVKNFDPYNVELALGDQLVGKMVGNNHYFLSFSDAIQGKTILELRFDGSSTSIQHTSDCEGFGPSFQVYQDAVVTKDLQELEIRFKKDGLVFRLDNGERHTLKLEGCKFPWSNVKVVEFGGNCKKTYGNWRNVEIERD